MKENLNETDFEENTELVTNKERMFRLIYLIIVSLWTVAGNILVLVAILKFTSLRRTTNVMLGSLAMADCLVGVVTVPLYILWMTSPGIFDSSIFMCGLVLLSCLLVVTASQISLLILSVEQYFAVCHPFKHRNALIHHPRLHTIAVVGTWTVSLLTTALSILTFNTQAKTCSYYGVFDKNFLFIASIIGVICPFFLIISLNIKVVCAVRDHDMRRQSLSANVLTLRPMSTSSNLTSKSQDSVETDKNYNSDKMKDALRGTIPENKNSRTVLNSASDQQSAMIINLFHDLLRKKSNIRSKSYTISQKNSKASSSDNVTEKGIFVVESKEFEDNISKMSLLTDGKIETSVDISVKIETDHSDNLKTPLGDGICQIDNKHINNINTSVSNENISPLQNLIEIKNDYEEYANDADKITHLSTDDINVGNNLSNQHDITGYLRKNEAENNLSQIIEPHERTAPTAEEKRKAFKLRSFSLDFYRKRSMRKFNSVPDTNDSMKCRNKPILLCTRSISQKSTSSQQRRKSSSSKDGPTSVSSRVANMVALVCASFILAWCPFFVVVLINTFCNDCNLTYFLNAVLIVAFTKSGTNPVIYALCHVAFRRAYSKLLYSGCLVRKSKQRTSVD